MADVVPPPTAPQAADVDARFIGLDGARSALAMQQAFEMILFPDDPRRKNLDPDPAKERRRVVQLRRQVDEVRSRIARQHADMVMDLAVLWAEGDWDTCVELEEAGHKAMLVAVDTFDPEPGVPFARWARLHVVRAAIRVLWPDGATPVDPTVLATVRNARDMVLMTADVGGPLDPAVVDAAAGAVPGVAQRTILRILAADLLAQERDLEERCARRDADDMMMRFAMGKAIEAERVTLDPADAALLTEHLGLDGGQPTAMAAIADRMGVPEGELQMRYRLIAGQLMERIFLISATG